jgi:hypothetical protein
MGVFNWLAEHWFDLIQTVGIIGGLLFTAHAIRKDERARTISNTIALNEQYTQTHVTRKGRVLYIRVCEPVCRVSDEGGFWASTA